MNRVVLHIDRLVLRGFAREDRDGIAEGLREELGRMLATPDAARHLMGQDGISRLKIGAVKIEVGMQPSAVGVQAARGIAKRIKP